MKKNIPIALYRYNLNKTDFLSLTLGEYLDIISIAKIDDLVELETNRKIIINAIRTSNVFGGKVKDIPIFSEKDLIFEDEEIQLNNNYISDIDKINLEKELKAKFL